MIFSDILLWYLDSLMLQFNSMRVWINNEYEKLRGFPKESHFLEGERKSPPQSTKILWFYYFCYLSLIWWIKNASQKSELKVTTTGFFKLINLFILFIFYFWLCWVFISMRGLSLIVASGGHSSSQCMGLSLWWPLLSRSTGSRHAGSVVVPHGPSCSTACGIFPDQGSNLCPLHWQADSQPLHHQGSPAAFFFKFYATWL